MNDSVGSWNYQNVQSVGGGFLTLEDKLRFYVQGRSGSCEGAREGCVHGEFNGRQHHLFVAEPAANRDLSGRERNDRRRRDPEGWFRERDAVNRRGLLDFEELHVRALERERTSPRSPPGQE